MLFSIIIPTLNESANLEFALKDLLGGIQYLADVEIIICDGGSEDDTLQLARQFPVQTIHSAAGRARQMNAGARHSMGNWLIFLHADTRLPRGWMELIRDSHGKWGRFDVRLSGCQRAYRVIEKAINLRSRRTSIATGDQAMFFRRDFFNHIDGFPDIPLMEDIAISKIARQYQSPACIRQPVITSSRRWEKKGIVRTVMTMWLLRFAYWIGVKPENLHRIYYPKT